MSMLKLKINVNLPQLLCIVVSVAQNGEFERLDGFCVHFYYTLQRSPVWKRHVGAPLWCTNMAAGK